MADACRVPCVLHGTMALMLADWLHAAFALVRAPALKVLRNEEMYRIENGEIIASDLPGLGLGLIPEALAEYRVRA